MFRNIDLNEISDGRRYGPHERVMADCGDCDGCSECCRVTGDTIVLDPRDAYELMKAEKKTFGELTEYCVELNVKDGLILPNLKVRDGDGCTFLTSEGMCGIHGNRPGFCRLFPLGRLYENGSHSYFLQVNECPKKDKAETTVCRQVGIENFDEYEKFIDDWHYFLLKLQKIAGLGEDERKNISTVILKFFYYTEYNIKADFYGQFYERLNYVKSAVGME